MVGKLNSNFIIPFKNRFEDICISLLLESYNKTKKIGDIRELDENDITVRLIGLMKVNQSRFDLQISIDRESHYDEEETYRGFKSADESVRIDIKYTTWSFRTEYEYFMEAKNLSENDWRKASTNSLVSAYQQRKRYIETGIQNLITGNYPEGCLIGYVVQGNPDKIIIKINKLLNRRERNSENLVEGKKTGFNYYCYSIHDGYKMERLDHYFLKFN